jgi:hypothetical protein
VSVIVFIHFNCGFPGSANAALIRDDLVRADALIRSFVCVRPRFVRAKQVRVHDVVDVRSACSVCMHRVSRPPRRVAAVSTLHQGAVSASARTLIESMGYRIVGYNTGMRACRPALIWRTHSRLSVLCTKRDATQTVYVVLLRGLEFGVVAASAAIAVGPREILRSPMTFCVIINRLPRLERGYWKRADCIDRGERSEFGVPK